MPTSARETQDFRNRCGDAWRCEALGALVELAAGDEGEGSPEEFSQALVAQLLQYPFCYRGAAIYQDGREGWTRIAGAGDISQPSLPVSAPTSTCDADADRDMKLVAGDLRLRIANGGRLLVLRRGDEPLAPDERAVLERLVDLATAVLDQRAYLTQLTYSERHYRHLYTHANLGIFFSRVGGGLQRANPAMLAMLGYATEREMRDAVTPLLNTQFYDPPADRRRLINALIAEGRVQDFQTRMRRADGSLIPVSLSAALVQDPDAQPHEDLEFFGFVTDLSINDHTLEARRDLRRAVAANHGKVRFLAALSHELRTPLNGVLGMLDVLAFDELKPVQVEALALIREAAGQLVALADRIYDYTRLESACIVLKDEIFSPQRLLDAATDRWRKHAVAQGVGFAVRVGAKVPVEVRGDEQRCGQILDQLLDNAIKYTPAGGRVVLEMAQEAEALQFCVTDSGRGIDAAQIERILADDDYDGVDFGLIGSGLGLAVVRRLVDLMEGRMWVESSARDGSRFSILLPLPAVSPEPGASAATEHAAGRRRVLVVEDNPVNQLVARKLLESLEMDVTVAAGAKDALAAVAQRSFAVVFMDLQMPDVDGFETTRALRTSCGYQGPIVAMTAHATQFYRDKCRHTGMNGFLTKPLQRARLADFVQRLQTAAAKRDGWLWVELPDGQLLPSD